MEMCKHVITRGKFSKLVTKYRNCNLKTFHINAYILPLDTVFRLVSYSSAACVCVNGKGPVGLDNQAYDASSHNCI